MPFLKRSFDLCVTLLAIPLWLPAMLLTSVAIFATCGWPVVYLSRRYVFKDTFRTVMKFRTMINGADKIANRDTIAPESGRMLNIIIDDQLYTPLGKFLEIIHFTELPQLLQVLTGTLTLVGNRPMPENMLAAARVIYPCLEERFSIPSGITGPAQLVGRHRLTDKERLKLEIAYAHICRQSYSPLLDLRLLAMSVMVPFGFYCNLSADELLTLMMRHVHRDITDDISRKVELLLSQ